MLVISRRKAIALIAAPAAAAALPAFAQTPAPQVVNGKLALLLVNDIYKMSEDKGRGGFARLSAVVKAERAKETPVIYAHAGDTFSPSLMSGFDQGEHIVALTNMAPPDVFVPGNHEFDFGKDAFMKRLSEAKFPFYAANMRQADGSAVPGVRDNDILERGAFKIGVFGVALPYTPQVSSSGDLKFGPTMDTVRAQAKLLRDRGADIVVCVAHTDRTDDLAIMQSRAVDVLLTGHDHDLALNYDGRVVMAESNEEANYVTAVDLAVTATMAGNTRTISWSPSFRIIDSRAVTPDPDTLALVKRYEADLSKELDVDIGTTAVELDSRNATVRGGEAAIGNLIADALKDVTGADITITNGGGIRGNKQYAAGQKLTRRDILTELPFGNSTAMVEIDGAAVKAALENGLSQYENKGGRFPHVAGMKVVFDPKQPVGSRIVSVDVGGAPLDLAKKYKVATNDFLVRGGDGYTTLGRGRKLIGDTDGKLMANEVMVYVRRLGTVQSKVEGRITVKP
ncbi:MAG: bifunctional metallophosphatase/5'-nucleotidase [Beijerinckiaceae bacterium]